VTALLFLILYVWAKYTLSVKAPSTLQPVFEQFSIILRMVIYTIYLITNKDKILTYIKRVKLNPAQSFSLGFIFLIFLGVWLLSLPYATVNPLSFLDRLFTSTSAVAVTGLIVVDTGAEFTLFGKIVLLFLIQTGGLGIMSFTTFLIILSGKKMGFYNRHTSMEIFNQQNFQTVKKLLFLMIYVTFIIEAIGALLIFLSVPKMPFDERLLFSIFHSISAFCNAGFSTLPDSLSGYYSSFNINMIIASLIIIGGIGFPVILNLKDKFLHGKKLTLHSKVVLMTSIFLIAGGMAAFYSQEHNGIMKAFSLPDKIMTSYFQSVTTRTAGFNTVDIGALQPITYVWIVFLMFIGASPGSTGGGLKTTTFFILTLMIYLFIKRRSEASVFRQKIGASILLKAGALFFIRILLIFFGTLTLLYMEDIDFIPALFESVSAFSTVGLSTGITASLSSVSKVVITLLMFIGRIGPLNVLASMSGVRQKPNRSLEYSEGYIILE
jgi:trk system potassium uptake protein TrkH